MKVKLGKYVHIQTGKLDANAAVENGEYPFFTCSVVPLAINSYSYDCECVLIAGNGDLNVKYYKGKFNAYQRTYIIESTTPALYVPYLYHFFCKYITTLRKHAIGGVIKYIKLEHLNDALIEFPTISVQKKICKKFQQLDETIEARKRQLYLLDQLVKSQFVEMFGNPQVNLNGYRLVKLSDVATYFNGLTYKPENVANTGLIVLRSSNIQNSQLDFADTVRVNCIVRERLIVQKNDILMCSRNGSAKLVGKVALIKDIQEPMSFGAFMMIIRSKYYSYLMTYFQMDAFRQQIKTGATTTINQITGRMLDDITIPLPPMPLVVQFATFVAQVDKSQFVEMFGDESKFVSQPLAESTVEMFIGPFGSSLKNDCFVSKQKAYCMIYEQKHAIRKTMNVETRYIDESKFKELKRFVVHSGDIIVSCRGTLGETFIVPKDAPIGIMHPSIMKIRIDTEKYEIHFFNELLKRHLRRHHEKAYGSGVKMAITATQLGKEKFIIPHIKKQKEFSGFLRQVDKSKFGMLKDSR